MKPCKKCKSENQFVGWSETQSGSTIFPYVCADCGEVQTQYATREEAEALVAMGKDVPRVETRTMRRLGGKKPRCVVCSAEGVERHHVAPSYLFGSESELWPIIEVCRACHRKWHDLVTPDMGKTKKVD